jgi:hypothetical protein
MSSERRPPVERTCVACGSTFLIATWITRRRASAYCSRACYYVGKVRSLSARVWAKVDRDGPIPPHRPDLDHCWTYTGHTNAAGYGWVNRGERGKQAMLAHRFTYEEAYGPIPQGLFVCHHCDNPPCLRPSHLFVASQAENMADMARKGRWHWRTRAAHESASSRP